MKNTNTPKRKRSKRKYRIASAMEWIKSYSGKNIVKGYSNWYGVDLICAIKELRMNGIEISEKYEKEIVKSLESNKNNRKKLQQEKDETDIQNEIFRSDFLFIAGYTSGGFPFGQTHSEKEDSQKDCDHSTSI